MSSTPEQIISPELAPDEEIVWIGTSSLWSVLPRATMMVLVGAMFAAAPFFSIEHKQNGFRFVIWAVFLFAGFQIAYGNLISILAVRRTAFAVTDRRALTVRRFLGTHVRSFPPGRVNILEYDVKADGSGSIAFRAEERPGSEAPGIEKIGFSGVQDVEGARLALMNLGVRSGGQMSKGEG